MNSKEGLLKLIVERLAMVGGAQKAVADRIGITQSDLSKLKRSMLVVSLDRAIAIAAKLGVVVTLSYSFGELPEVASGEADEDMAARWKAGELF